MLLTLAAVLTPALAFESPPVPAPLGFTQPAPGQDFPPTDALLGKADDPLDALTANAPVDGTDLRDALNSPPSPAWLPGGLLASNRADRLSAIRAAAVPRRVSAVPHLSGVMLRLDEAPELRAAAAVALGHIGDPIAASALAEALKDPSEEVRYAAALALGRVAADGAATHLSAALRADPSWWVRYAAALALGRTRKPFAAAALEECLRHEPKWQIRLAAVRSLQDLGGPRAADAAALALRDEDSGVRTLAALALGEIGGDSQLSALGAAVKVEPDPSARSAQSAAFRHILSKP